MRIWLAYQDKVEPIVHKQFANRLTGVQIITQKRLFVALIVLRITFDPALDSFPFTILLLMPILEIDEFWLLHYHSAFTRLDNHWQDSIVNLQNFTVDQRTLRTILTMDPLR